MRAGLAEVPEDAAAVLVHDAARPLLTDEVIERVLAALADGWDGVVPGLPVSDTVKRVGRTAGRRDARRATGSGRCRRRRPFRVDALRAALAGDCGRDRLRRARRGARRPRDKSFPGDPRLLKVTTAEDLARVASLL